MLLLSNLVIHLALSDIYWFCSANKHLFFRSSCCYDELYNMSHSNGLLGILKRKQKSLFYSDIATYLLHIWNDSLLPAQNTLALQPTSFCIPLEKFCFCFVWFFRQYHSFFLILKDDKLEGISNQIATISLKHSYVSCCIS